MRVAARLSLVIGVGLVLCCAGTTWAQAPTTDSRLLVRPTNETGFTLGDLLEQHLWVLVQHPLAPETLSRVSAEVHRAPRRGVQFELLTPGDAGVTIHFRW